MKAYKHTQTGYSVITLLLIAFLIVFYYIYVNGFGTRYLITLIVLSIAMMIFSKLTVVITETKVVSYFNFKLFKKTVFYKDIEKVELVDTPFYYLGIRFLLNGLLYTVGGKKALQLTYKNGKFFRVGTDSPLVLLRETLHFFNTQTEQ